MYKLLLLALVSSCCTILQFGLTGMIFNEDWQCRTEFSNMTECQQSLIGFCHCRESIIGDPKLSVSVFDELSVAMASILFIGMTCLEIQRFIFCGYTLLCSSKNHHHLSLLELLSPIGFFTMLLTPALKNTLKDVSFLCRQYSILTMLFDFLAIGTISRYSYETRTFIFETPMLIVVGGFSIIDIFIRMGELYLANKRDFEASEKLLNISPPPFS